MTNISELFQWYEYACRGSKSIYLYIPFFFRITQERNALNTYVDGSGFEKRFKDFSPAV